MLIKVYGLNLVWMLNLSSGVVNRVAREKPTKPARPHGDPLLPMIATRQPCERLCQLEVATG